MCSPSFLFRDIISIKTFRGVIFSESDIDVFEENAVKVFCAIDIFRCALGRRDERLMVLFQFLLVQSNLDGISAESVNGIDENDIPKHGFFCIGKHPLKFCAVIVRSRGCTVSIGVDDRQPVFLRKVAAYAELAFNRLVILLFAGISCVNNCHIFLWTLFRRGPKCIFLKERRSF